MGEFENHDFAIIEHEPTDESSDFFIKYGSTQNWHAGSHELELKGALRNYTSIYDDRARIQLTLYRLTSSLKILNHRYMLKMPTMKIEVPTPAFYPELHPSRNPKTGKSGNEIITQVHLLNTKGLPVPLAPELIKFEAEEMEL